jgi:choline dehydrogenase-like flavoprotein
MARGKLLGGSSAINLMGLALAGAVEYDGMLCSRLLLTCDKLNILPEIGRLGNSGWSYSNTLKYFKKATNMSVAPPDLQRQTHATFSPEFHGSSGVGSAIL